MSPPLESTNWHRVATLRPRLAADAGLARQTARGRTWHVLTEASSARQVRLNAAAWAFAGRCDGSLTVEAIWRDLLERHGEACPTQDDILRLLARLHAAGLLRFDGTPDLDALFQARGQERRRRARARVNPLALRLRLFDPSPMVERLWPIARHLLDGRSLALMALLTAFAALTCIAHAEALGVAIARAQDAPRTLVLLWLVIPAVKAVHELAHALVVRRFGGQVRHAGITLMLLTPAPWVDASAATMFPHRGARIAVSAAGIAAELVIAALAACVWLAVEPGLVRDAALVTLAVCGLSTLAINANPLVRLDGYHVLTDLLELPNLALRSQAWWSEAVRRALHGPDAGAPVALPPGEAKWLVLYAPASALYRLGLCAGFVLWVGHLSAPLGLMIGAVFCAWLAWKPLAALVRAWRAAPTTGSRARAGLAAATVAALGACAIFALPLPAGVTAPGVVWPQDDAQVRAGSGGFVVALDSGHGTRVAPDQAIATLVDDALEAELARARSALAGHQARQYAALLHAPAEAAGAALDIERAEAELARAEERVALLRVRARGAGRLVLPREADLPGAYAARGAMLGYVLGDGPANVRAILEEDDALRVREGARAVEVRLVSAEGRPLAARWQRDMPAATHELPSAALGERAGGPFAIEPGDREARRTPGPVFQVDVAVNELAQDRVGARAWVRFDLGFETLGARGMRHLRQLLLRHFDPAGRI